MDWGGPANTESELESFRQRWRNEVSARSKSDASQQTKSRTRSGASGLGRQQIGRLPPPAERTRDAGASGDGDIRTYHDVENKEEYLKLGNELHRSEATPREPVSALEHYERAVERENQGSLGDSISHYRRAFKLDAAVQEAYKRKHFPTVSSTSKPNNTNPSNASPTVPNPAHHSLDGPPQTLAQLIDAFSQTSIAAAEPETSLSRPRPCPIAGLPEEVLVEILHTVGQKDVGIFSKLALSSKRISYLIMTEDRIWKPIAMGLEHGIRGMHYAYACNVQGERLLYSSDVPVAPAQLDLTPSVYPTYRAQFRSRPRIRFHGCYISTVNYTRPGGASQSLLNWTTPVHIVTYYRYLRFFRDGTCISLLTTTEPADTIHHLTHENLHKHHTGTMPSAVMKDALRGRWRLSGARKIPPDEDHYEEPKGPGEYDIEPSEVEEVEPEGELYIETEGVIPKYMWKMQFSIGSAGRKDGTRNNKLSWKGFWSYNRLTDDWGEFGLKNDRPL